jgi:hypothetical protein
MLIFDEARHSYVIMVNWMGQQTRIPIFMIGPYSRWSLNG